MDQIIIIVLTLIFLAFFSLSELTFLSTNRLLIELNRKITPLHNKITEKFYKNPGIFISAIISGYHITLIVFVIFMAKTTTSGIKQWVDNLYLIWLIQILISTIIVIIIREFLPKILLRMNPVFILNILTIPLAVFYVILYPFSILTQSISNSLIKKTLKIKEGLPETDSDIGIDLDHLISDQQEKAYEDDPSPKEIKFFKNALDFSNVKIRECLVPRTDLQAVEEKESLENIKIKFIESGLSKILIYKDTIDNIIGYVHVSALFHKPTQLKNIISPILVVPETMPANQLLEIFIKKHKSIVLVVDEFGGTAGIVTLEDLLEEIFGEIDDEHDISDLVEKQISDDTFQLSGRFEIDYLNEKYNLDLPVSDNYETLAGLILFYNEAIPKEKEEFEIADFRFRIIEASKSKIELVQITRNTDTR